MLIELGRDPLVIKHTRIGTIYGLANLMDTALEDAGKLRQPALILYGERDEIIPKRPTRLMLERIEGNGNGAVRVALYEGGYHMLLRDLPAWTSPPGSKTAPRRCRPGPTAAISACC